MKIRFIFPRHDFEINLVSKYTCFVGQDSGEGKTELLSLIEDSVQIIPYKYSPLYLFR